MATRMLLGASPAQRKNQALDYEEQQRRLLGNPGQAAVQGDYNAQVAQEARYNVPQTVQPGLQGIYPHLTDQGRAVAAAGASQSAVLPYGGGSLPGTVAGTGEMAGGAAAAGAAERNRRMTTAEAAAAATYTAPPQTATPWDAKAMQRIVAESAQSRALQASGGGVMMTGPANNTTARIVGGPTPAPDLRTQANMLPLQTGVAAGHAMLQGTRAAGNMAESGGNLAVARNQADQGAVARTTETATRRGEIVNEGLGQDVRGAGLRNDMAGQDLRIRTDQANINPAMLNEGLLGARNQNRVGTAGAGVAERQAKAIGSLTDPQLTQGMGLTPSPASAQQANADRIAQQMSDMRMSAAAEPDPERRAEMLRQIEQMNQAMISAQGMEAVQEPVDEGILGGAYGAVKRFFVGGEKPMRTTGYRNAAPQSMLQGAPPAPPVGRPGAVGAPGVAGPRGYNPSTRESAALGRMNDAALARSAHNAPTNKKFSQEYIRRQQAADQMPDEALLAAIRQNPNSPFLMGAAQRRAQAQR